MSGPWYEEQGITTAEVRKQLLTTFLAPKGNYKFVSDDNIKSIVDSVIKQEEQKKQDGVLIEVIIHLFIVT